MPHIILLDSAPVAVRAPQPAKDTAGSLVRLRDATSIRTSSTISSTSAEVYVVPSASTSNAPFFPTSTQTENSGDNRSLNRTKTAVEGAIIVAAVALIIGLSLWRAVRIRRSGRHMRDFFVAHPQPDVPPRPRDIPRTTGLPLGSAVPTSVIYDSMMSPVPLVHRGASLAYDRRGRRRVRAGDIGAGGRRGQLAHPDDPEEFLPEYDDKDVLPRYQDVNRANAVVGLEGHSPNNFREAAEAAGETSDTIPLVTRMQLPGNPPLNDLNGTSQGLSPLGSHEGNEMQDRASDS